MSERIGILGAGKLGLVLARLAAAAGYEVRIAGSGDPKYIALNVGVFARGASATTAAEAIEGAHLVILAIPLHRVADLPGDMLAGHVVIDATNYWLAVDGPLPHYANAPGGTSSAVAAHLACARVVKALNHVAYEDLDAHAREVDPHVARPIALGIASDDSAAADAVATFIRAIGFEPVRLGGLAAGVVLEPGGRAFGGALTADALTAVTLNGLAPPQ